MTGRGTGDVDFDVTLTNCTMSGFTTSNNTVWTKALAPSGQGEVTAAVAAGVCNRVGSPATTNVASSSFSRMEDSVAPTVGLGSSGPDPTNTVIPVTITYSEAIDPATFSAADISVSGGGSVAAPQSSDDTVFTTTATPVSQGSVVIGLAAHHSCV